MIIFNLQNYLKERLETARTQVSFYHSNETKEVCNCMFKTTAKLCSITAKSDDNSRLNVKFNLNMLEFTLHLCGGDTGLQS